MQAYVNTKHGHLYDTSLENITFFPNIISWQFYTAPVVRL